MQRDDGSFEEIDESVAEQAERRAKVTNICWFVFSFLYITTIHVNTHKYVISSNAVLVGCKTPR